MSSVIRVLDEHTINKIAAGEVIENPASVVKELVENAIDAGASEITIEIKGGGRQLIRITDNGSGMSQDDALLSLERHATSKIRDINDIHAISTMGFRGEAVPSIAAISKLSILTCRECDKQGCLVSVEGGKIHQCVPAARAPGTTFEIKSLFYNVPVRKKFQRSPTYDTSEITKAVILQALAHPQIKFQLISNQKSILTTKIPKTDSLLKLIGERISDLLGLEFYRGLKPVEKESNGFKIQGYCGAPYFNRHNRTGQYLFINQRAVFSPLISYAVRDAYGTTLATNRHPVFVLYLTMNGSFVDVNVHPQKREVRIRQEYELKEFISSAIKGAVQHNEIPSFTPSAPKFTPPVETYRMPIVTKPTLTINETPSFFETEKVEDTRSKVITTLPGYILLVSHQETLQILDQRAAHARILYEALLQTNKSTKLPSQSFLVPFTLHFEATESILLNDHLHYLQNIGIQIQNFGNNSFIINGAPQIIPEGKIEETLRQIIYDLNKYHKETLLEKEVQKRICLAASKTSLPKQKKLSFYEAQTLYHQLLKCETPLLSPLGKPTIIELTQDKIAKYFNL